MRGERGLARVTAIVASALLFALTDAATATAGAATFREFSVGRLGAGPARTSGGADVTAPQFTRRPAFSPARFRNRAARGTAASYLVFAISEAAELNLRFSRARPGRRAHGRCVAPSHANRAKRRCTRWVDLGTTSGHALAGADKIPFAPRIAGHLLAPGSYRVSVTATDAAGNGSAPATAGFTIEP